MSTTVVTVWAHPDKYEKDFNAVAAILTRYIDKRAPTLSVKVTSVGQTRPDKWQMTSDSHGISKGKVEFKKHSSEEYDSVLMTHH